MVLETRAQTRGQRFHGATRRSGRSGGEHCRRRVVRHELGQSRGRRNTLYQDRQQPLAPDRQPRAEIWRRFHLQRRPHHLPAGLPRQLQLSSLANFLAGVYNNAGFTQTFGAFEVSQTNPNLALHAQDEWKLSSRITLNRRPLRPAVAGNHCGRLGQSVTARRRRVVALRRRERSCAATPASSTTACRSAPSPMPCSRPATRPTCRSCARSRSACRRPRPLLRCSRDPREQRAIRDSSQSDDDGSRLAERLLAPGKRGGRAADRRAQNGQRRVSLRPRRAAADVHQPERARLRRLGQQQRLPAQPRLREQQPVFVGRHVHVSRPARVAAASAGTLGPAACRTRCRKR